MIRRFIQNSTKIVCILSLAISMISCSGDDGVDGQNGVDGTNGTNGTNGAPGAPGANGEDGAPGIGFNESTKFGALHVTLAGSTPKDVTFNIPINFLYLFDSVFYDNAIYEDEDGILHFRITREVSINGGYIRLRGTITDDIVDFEEIAFYSIEIDPTITARKSYEFNLSIENLYHEDQYDNLLEINDFTYNKSSKTLTVDIDLAIPETHSSNVTGHDLSGTISGSLLLTEVEELPYN